MNELSHAQKIRIYLYGIFFVIYVYNKIYVAVLVNIKNTKKHRPGISIIMLIKTANASKARCSDVNMCARE